MGNVKERRSRINKFVQRTYPQVVQLFCIKRGNIFDWILGPGIQYSFSRDLGIPNELRIAAQTVGRGDQPRRRYTVWCWLVGRMNLANLLCDIGFSNRWKPANNNDDGKLDRNKTHQTHIHCHVSRPKTTFLHKVVNKQTLRYDSNKPLTSSGFIAQLQSTSSFDVYLVFQKHQSFKTKQNKKKTQ